MDKSQNQWVYYHKPKAPHTSFCWTEFILMSNLALWRFKDSSTIYLSLSLLSAIAAVLICKTWLHATKRAMKITVHVRPWPWVMAFSNAATKLWNSLPIPLRDRSPEEVFKKNLKTYLFRTYVNDFFFFKHYEDTVALWTYFHFTNCYHFQHEGNFLCKYWQLVVCLETENILSQIYCLRSSRSKYSASTVDYLLVFFYIST